MGIGLVQNKKCWSSRDGLEEPWEIHLLLAAVGVSRMCCDELYVGGICLRIFRILLKPGVY